MYVIVGLGNPSKKYDKTRHNVGFDVIDELASKLDVDVKTKRHRALCGIGNVDGEKVILVKPQTYMNSRELPGKKGTFFDRTHICIKTNQCWLK